MATEHAPIPATAVTVRHETKLQRRKAARGGTVGSTGGRISTPTLRHQPTTFTTARAQRWIIAAALITAMTYAFRRMVEGPLAETSGQQNHGSTLSRFVGSGSPPVPLAHWALAYGAGFLGLSLLALGAPELAGALAVLEIAGTVLTNGSAIATDLNLLQHEPATKDPGAPPPPAGLGLTNLGIAATAAGNTTNTPKPSTTPGKIGGKVPAKGGIGHRNIA